MVKNAPHLANVLNFEKCGSVEKMCHLLKSAENLKKLLHLKNVIYLKKCATLRKMLYTWKNAPNFEKYGTLGKMGHTKKYAPHENPPHLEKCTRL